MIEHRWTYPVREVKGNYDGDTIDVMLDLGFHTFQRHSIRLKGVDTPELRGGTHATKALARKARDFVTRWLSESSSLTFHCTEFAGKYGRPIGDFTDENGAILSRVLIEERLGVAYDGGSRAAIQANHEANARHHGLTSDS